MKINVKDLSYMALYVALSVVLEYVSKFIPILQMPSGGSITLGLLPVFMASYHLGWKKGLSVGLLWWLVSSLMGLNEWYLNPIQYSLDYIIPAAICGLASLFPKVGKISNLYIGMVITMFARFAAQVISGVYYWPANEVAGSGGAWIYSLGYNFGYNFVTLILAAILVPLLVIRLNKTERFNFIGVK
ncbi:energy-coupled thiamine transporter ThiT [Anaerorhabdus sp.]|jgi:thiamine transporter|uniref:energy-coupled thiamine transporter ThiT n=1 Tax=Anaerorhabdus sp. TaxID=1872524 RepID=UPI002FC67E32